jgi:hypothetical protein
MAVKTAITGQHTRLTADQGIADAVTAANSFTPTAVKPRSRQHSRLTPTKLKRMRTLTPMAVKPRSRTAYQAYADTAEADAVTAANDYTDGRETAITTAYQAADANLQSQISTNRADIDRNARGIAMVAALTHTTVLPGMTHALDVSAAHFEGETGMANQLLSPHQGRCPNQLWRCLHHRFRRVCCAWWHRLAMVVHLFS